MKRVLSVFLTAVLLLVMCPLSPMVPMTVSASTYDGFEYTVNDDGITATITGYSGTYDVMIPSKIYDYTVTSIGYSAFYGCSDLTSITIPYSVTTIGDWAFYSCSKLKSIVIPECVTSIGNYAFHSCSNLVSVTISDSVTEIGQSAFEECTKLTALYYTGTVDEWVGISFATFSSNPMCYATKEYFNDVLVTDVVVTEGIASIGNYAFYDCNSLDWITIPESVTSIGYQAFYSCNKLTSFGYTGTDEQWNAMAIGDDNSCLTSATRYCASRLYTQNGATYAMRDDTLTATVLEYNGTAGTFSIPAAVDGYTVTSIANKAFYKCSDMISVSIPDSVTRIGDYAFYCCRNLSYITIPDSVTSIGECAFYGCTLLSTITISSGVTSIGNAAFYDCDNLVSVTISDSVTSIGDAAFYDCERIVVVGYTGTEEQWDMITIGDNNSCLRLAARYYTATLFNGCNMIYAFYDDTQTATAVEYTGTSAMYEIPAEVDGHTVTRIGFRAFYGCKTLVRLTIPAGVTSIGTEAFYGCDNLKIVAYAGTQQQWDTMSSYGSLPGATYFESRLYAEDDLVYALHNDGQATVATYLGEDTMVAIPAEVKGYDVTCIASYAFRGCTSLTTITIPEGVTSIGSYAFYGCTTLLLVPFPDSVTTVGHGVFTNTAYYNKGDWKDGLLYNGNYLVAAKSKVVSGSVAMRPGTKAMATQIFANCTALTSVTIPDGITHIPPFAFEGCSRLQSIDIPDGTIKIGSHAFSGCSSLQSIDIPDGVIEIDSYAFGGCGSLRMIDIPDGVTRIEQEIFAGCSSLGSITVPNGVTNIDTSAFTDCVELAYIVIPDSVTEIGKGAFEGCDKLYAVSYEGTKAQWDAVRIGAGNSCLKSATMYDESKMCVQGGLIYVLHEDMTATVAAYCGEQTTVTILDKIADHTVTHISDVAFRDSARLEAVTIGDGVTSIDVQTFSGCQNLVSVEIGDSVTNIDASAFNGCNSLASVTISDGVTRIGNAAFYNCISLTSIVVPNGVTEIGWRAFAECENLVSVTMSDNVTSIGDEVFYNCTALASIVIPEGISDIGDKVFSGCSNLTSVTLPDSVTSIGDRAFYGCDNAVDIHYRGTADQWVDIFFSCEYSTPTEYALYLDSELVTDIVLSEDVTSIGDYAFHGCNSLTNITIPASVTEIGSYAFGNCNALQSVYYGGTADDWVRINFANSSANPISYAENAYFNGALVVDVVLSNGVKSINAYAFYGCNSLASIVIPNSVWYIARGAFAFCSSLTDVYYSGDEYGWDAISIVYVSPGKDAKEYSGIYNATIHYNAVGIESGTTTTTTITSDSTTTTTASTTTTTVPVSTTTTTEPTSTTSTTTMSTTTTTDTTTTTVIETTSTTVTEIVTTTVMETTASIIITTTVVETTTTTTEAQLDLKGDLNGDGKVTIMDAVLLYYYVNGKTPLANENSADMNGDGNVNIVDAVKLYYFVNGKITVL